jgi:hypothetical protein
MPISIDLFDTHFFIAIGKKKGHSFIMLGIHKANKVQELLCRVGKVFDLKENADKEVEICSVFDALAGASFSSTAAKIQDEGLNRKKLGHDAISYQAYEISFQQYLEFIRILESIQTARNSFKCYKPISRTYNTILLESTREKVLKARPLAGTLFSAIHDLSLDNNCRHGAIKLVEETLGQPVSPLVSTNFFNDLPYKTFLDFGVPSQDIPFYVLPPPPNSYTSLNAEKIKILEKLYNRMEQILLLDPNSEATQKKFNCLKDFYKGQIAEEIKEPSIERLLYNIQTWKKENYQVLTTLRKTYFWDELFTRKSATLNMIEEMEGDLMDEMSSLCPSRG